LIVLFIYQKIDLAVVRQQADRGAVLEAFLAAIPMLCAVLAQGCVAGQVDDFAYPRPSFSQGMNSEISASFLAQCIRCQGLDMIEYRLTISV
jgi:hypothetical protein